ncbi:hypothetical protein [Thomasclavelia cocleata]|uniref:hypothetical protein n=1 Tax=Thomasclavelia cocleata TaxID=69824 RepID=UPI00258C4EB3|nr:hypothetical protein [Thomasclavelia cocleata]
MEDIIREVMESKEQDLGRVSIIPKGGWQLSEPYERLDMVVFENRAYIARKDVPANTELIIDFEANDEYWMPFQYHPYVTADVSDDGTFIFNGRDSGIEVNRIGRVLLNYTILDEWRPGTGDVNFVYNRSTKKYDITFILKVPRGVRGYNIYEYNGLIDPNIKNEPANIINPKHTSIPKAGDFLIDKAGDLYKITVYYANEFRAIYVLQIKGNNIYRIREYLLDNDTVPTDNIEHEGNLYLHTNDILIDNNNRLFRITNIDTNDMITVTMINNLNAPGTFFANINYDSDNLNNLDLNEIDSYAANRDIYAGDKLITKNNYIATISSINKTNMTFNLDNDGVRLKGDNSFYISKISYVNNPNKEYRITDINTTYTIKDLKIGDTIYFPNDAVIASISSINIVSGFKINNVHNLNGSSGADGANGADGISFLRYNGVLTGATTGNKISNIQGRPSVDKIKINSPIIDNTGIIYFIQQVNQPDFIISQAPVGQAAAPINLNGVAFYRYNGTINASSTNLVSNIIKEANINYKQIRINSLILDDNYNIYTIKTISASTFTVNDNYINIKGPKGDSGEIGESIKGADGFNIYYYNGDLREPASRSKIVSGDRTPVLGDSVIDKYGWVGIIEEFHSSTELPDEFTTSNDINLRGTSIFNTIEFFKGTLEYDATKVNIPTEIKYLRDGDKILFSNGALATVASYNSATKKYTIGYYQNIRGNKNWTSKVNYNGEDSDINISTLNNIKNNYDVVINDVIYFPNKYIARINSMDLATGTLYLADVWNLNIPEPTTPTPSTTAAIIFDIVPTYANLYIDGNLTTERTFIRDKNTTLNYKIIATGKVPIESSHTITNDATLHIEMQEIVLTAAPASLTFDVTGGQKEIEITSNVPYTITKE